MSGKPVTPLLATDCVIFAPDGGVVLIRRKNPPFQGEYALPGGFVDVGETVEDACRREMLEEVSLRIENPRLVGVYSDPARDPRGHCVSIAFRAHADLNALKAGDDAASVTVVRDWRREKLAFDHRKIIEDALALDL